MNYSFLSNTWKEIIIGSLLGDGSIQINDKYRNARFSFRHSIKQKDYFDWKVKELQAISGPRFMWKQKSGFGDGEIWRYQSKALPELTEIYKLTHVGKRLTVRRKWLNKLTPLSLAIWWLDDGSLIANGRKGVICTDSFTCDEHKLLAAYLLKARGVKVNISKVKKVYKGNLKEYYRLWFRSSEELKKFLRLVLPYIKVSSMLYKVILLYKDSNLQQRWISEVSNLTGFSENFIQKIVNEKKNKWKAFSENDIVRSSE